MTYLYFFDEHNSSKQNGIGTYRDILLPALTADSHLTLTLISMNSDYPVLTELKHDFGREIALPFVGGGDWRSHGAEIRSMIKPYVIDSTHNLFLINHSPCSNFIDVLKESFPNSKIAFVVHDQGWCERLYGDKHMLAELEAGHQPTEVSDSTADFVRDYCRQEREIYDRADAVVCLSKSTHHILHDIYQTPESKIFDIPNGHSWSTSLPPKASARKMLGICDDELLMVFVARPARYKGILPLFKAIGSIRTKHTRLRCALIGNAYGFIDYWDLGHRIAPNLILTGQLSPKDVRMWYAAADIGILPSYSEQCSFAALEMMNAGLTIVASDGNGLCDMFKDGQNAFVAPIGDVMDIDSYASRLAYSIDRAIEASTDQIERFVDFNKKLIASRFAIDTMRRGYLRLCRQLT